MGCIKTRQTKQVVECPKDKVLYNREVHTKRRFATGIEGGKGDIGLAGHFQVSYNLDKTEHYDKVPSALEVIEQDKQNKPQRVRSLP